jgi:hypothetical protein
VPVASEFRHLDLHFLPEDPSRPLSGGGRGKGEAGGAGLPRTLTRRPLAAAVAPAAQYTQDLSPCSLTLREQYFIRRVASATRFVGAARMLIRRITTHATSRRIRLGRAG